MELVPGVAPVVAYDIVFGVRRLALPSYAPSTDRPARNLYPKLYIVAKLNPATP